MATPVLFKVNLKKNKKEPCRICNTKTRPCIDLIKNKELKATVNSALGLIVSPDSRLSKAICVVCMSLVRMFDEFKKICFDNQNDLWKMESQMVPDRGAEVFKLLLQAKSMSIPGQTEKAISETVTLEPELEEYSEPKRTRYESLGREEIPEAEYGENDSEITVEEEMIEEHLEETFDNPPPIRYMCTNINCDRLFETKDEMEVHTKTHKIIRPRTRPYTSIRRNETLKEDSYTCQVCRKVFEDIAGLVQHRKMNHFPKKCGFCGLAVPTETFAAHQAQCRRDNAKKLGILEPKRIGGIKTEIVSLPPDTPLFKCGFCSLEFRTIQSYKQHYKACSTPS